MRLCLGSLLLGLPLWAGDLYLLPDSFFASVSERLVVRVHDGRKFPFSEKEPQLADSAIYTAKAAYNLLSPRHESNALVLEGNLKSSGTAVLAVESKSHTDFAKALVIVETADQNVSKQLGTALELVPEANPRLGENSFRIFYRRSPLSKASFELLSEAGVSETGLTNEDGKGTLRIAMSGRYLIRAAHANLSASLTFEVR